MPIVASTPIRCLSQDEYHAIDRVLVGHAFKIHNQYGGLLDEAVYKSLLAERVTKDGIPAVREVALHVSHGAFAKSYFIDLLLDGSTIVEVRPRGLLRWLTGGRGSIICCWPARSTEVSSIFEVRRLSVIFSPPACLPRTAANLTFG